MARTTPEPVSPSIRTRPSDPNRLERTRWVPRGPDTPPRSDPHRWGSGRDESFGGESDGAGGLDVANGSCRDSVHSGPLPRRPAVHHSRTRKCGARNQNANRRRRPIPGITGEEWCGRRAYRGLVTGSLSLITESNTLQPAESTGFTNFIRPREPTGARTGEVDPPFRSSANRPLLLSASCCQRIDSGGRIQDSEWMQTLEVQEIRNLEFGILHPIPFDGPC
jgi:hypothetical protein